MGYTKLFNEIIMSTVWREPNHVRLLWITMLALKDQYHTVNASLPGLADAARITMDECIEALTVLKSPDPFSRTKENEGRRVAECDGGWLILNGEKYRQKMNTDERREYKTQKQREYRERSKKSVDSSVDSGSELRTVLTHKEEETDTKEKKIKTKRFVKPSVDEINIYCRERKNAINAEQFFAHYESNGWKVGKNPMKNWKAAVITWEKRDNNNGQNQQSSGSRTQQFNSELDRLAHEAIERGETL